MIRLDKVCTLLKDLIIRELGFVGDLLRRELTDSILFSFVVDFWYVYMSE